MKSFSGTERKGGQEGLQGQSSGRENKKELKLLAHWRKLYEKQSQEKRDGGEFIPGYDLYLLLGVVCVISTIIIKKRFKSIAS